MALPRIITETVKPPIADRRCDYLARYEGDEADDNDRLIVGWGPTEAEAVVDLIENYPRGVQCERDLPYLTAVTREAARSCSQE